MAPTADSNSQSLPSSSKSPSVNTSTPSSPSSPKSPQHIQTSPKAKPEAQGTAAPRETEAIEDTIARLGMHVPGAPSVDDDGYQSFSVDNLANPNQQITEEMTMDMDMDMKQAIGMDQGFEPPPLESPKGPVVPTNHFPTPPRDLVDSPGSLQTPHQQTDGFQVRSWSGMKNFGGNSRRMLGEHPGGEGEMDGEKVSTYPFNYDEVEDDDDDEVGEDEVVEKFVMPTFTNGNFSPSFDAAEDVASEDEEEEVRFLQGRRPPPLNRAQTDPLYLFLYAERRRS